MEEDEGVLVERVPILGRLAFAPIAPGFGRALRRAVAGFKPDILHLHLPNLAGAYVLGLRPPCALVLHWHADVVSGISPAVALGRLAYGPIERGLLRRAAMVVATSEAYLETSRPLAPFRNKCRVVPLGLDPGRFAGLDAAAAAADADDGATVLAVGRLAFYKGFEHLVAAAASLPSGARVVVAGEGPFGPRLKALAARLGLGGRVLFPGLLTDPELFARLATCAAFCLPSVERTEAFGVALLEAMAFARPLVTTAVPGSGMGLVNAAGETGLVVPLADPEALAGALAKLLAGADTRRRMGRAGRERLLALFSIDRAAAALSRVYAEALGEPRGRGASC